MFARLSLHYWLHGAELVGTLMLLCRQGQRRTKKVEGENGQLTSAHFEEPCLDFFEFKKKLISWEKNRN